jgi:hypothetical protein
MADRDYFDLRYAIPGFTFLLFVILINYSPIIALLSGSDNPYITLATAFLTFVTLLSGSAIGFIISQIWFLGHNKQGGIMHLKDLAKLKTRFNEKFKPKFEALTEVEKNRYYDLMVTYILHHQNSERQKFIQRRADIYQTLSCTALALFLSVCVGAPLRLYFEYTVFYGSFLISAEWQSAIIEVIILAIPLALLGVLMKSRKYPLLNYCGMLMASINEDIIGEKQIIIIKLKEAFPEIFKKNENKAVTT